MLLETNSNPEARLAGRKPPEQLMVGKPDEFDAVQPLPPLPSQFMRMNPIKVPAFCAWVVLGGAAGTPGPGSWATVSEAVSSARMNKKRFIASVFAAQNQFTCAPPRYFRQLIPDGENCDGLKVTSHPRCDCQSNPPLFRVAHGTGMFSDSKRFSTVLKDSG
jgi:hypothetical protein